MYILQIKKVVLNISDSQEWDFYTSLWFDFLAFGETSLNLSKSFERLDLPMLQHLPQPLHAAGLIGRVTGKAHG